MVERYLENNRRRRKPSVEGMLPTEQRPEVLEFNVAVEQIAQHVIGLLKDKPLVTAHVFGWPNAGKSELAHRVISRIQAQLGHPIEGGEMKGYDEKPSDYGLYPPEVYFIQQVTYPLPELSDHEDMMRSLNEAAANVGMPPVDFTIVISNPAIQRVDPAKFIGKADYIVRNTGSRVK